MVAEIETLERKVLTGLRKAEKRMRSRRAECAFGEGEASVEPSDDGLDKPLALTLCLERSVVSAGGPLKLRYALHNISRSTKTLPSDALRGPGRIYENLARQKGVHFDIVGPSGRRLRPSFRFLSKPEDASAAGRPADKARWDELLPGSTRRVPSDPDTYLVLDRFPLDCPGLHTIQAVLNCLELPGVYCRAGSLRSRKLRFQVVFP